jgi:ferredoxin-NADP reductase
MSMARKIRCTVKAIADHGGQVYTLDLSPAGPVPAFRPGQFLHLTVDDYDPSSFWPESRVFSIASSPRERNLLRICYSVKGRYTTRMEQNLAVGREVWAKLPYGDFVIQESEEAVLLAGGTGISAFTAFVGALKPDQARPVWLVYGARSPELLLFREMLLAQLRSVPNLHALFFTETGKPEFGPEAAGGSQLPECLTGRISLDAVWSRLKAPLEKVFYLSGPPVMLKTLSDQLAAKGVAADRIRKDAWE